MSTGPNANCGEQEGLSRGAYPQGQTHSGESKSGSVGQSTTPPDSAVSLLAPIIGGLQTLGLSQESVDTPPESASSATREHDQGEHFETDEVESKTIESAVTNNPENSNSGVDTAANSDTAPSVQLPHPPQVLSYARRHIIRDAFAHLEGMRTAMLSESKVAFVFVDIEWWEKDRIKSKCTEVGVATLYKPATEPASFYGCTHFVVREMYHRRNGTYIPDHKDDFNQEFGGKSTPISAKDLGAAIDNILASVRNKGETYLVVHGGLEDIDWLKRWNCSIDGLTVLDTQRILQAIRYEERGAYSDGSNLGNMLSKYGIVPRNLHNGGNDAGYTMKAFQAMAAVPKGPFGREHINYSPVIRPEDIQW